jgi:hypothetical protein
VAHEHAQHCHGQAATCTDLPLTAGSGLAQLSGWLTAALMVVCAGLGRPLDEDRRLAGRSPAVPTPPPRFALLTV